MTSDTVKRAARRALRYVPPVERAASSFYNAANRGQRLRAAGRTVVFDVRTRLLGKPTRARVGQHSWIIAYPGETNSPHAVYRNPPNWPEMHVWQRRLKPGDLFVDIGANVGVYTIFVLDLGAEVIAIEPDAASVRRIREHLDLNGYTAEVVNKALAAAPGTMRMTTGHDSMNHLLLDDDDGVVVEVTTLDDVLGDRTVAGLKVDVQGAERLVLEGAPRALAEHRIKLLQLEWNEQSLHLLGETREPVAKILTGHGYRLCRPNGRGDLVPVEGVAEMGRDVFALAPGVGLS